MTSPYLDQPLLPLAVALPRMLQEVEAALATAGLAETRRLRQRAELLRGLLTAPARPKFNQGVTTGAGQRYQTRTQYAPLSSSDT